MQSLHISFELFRELCKGQLFNTCRHPGNGHEGALHSCCASFCPVIEEAKRRKAAEEFNNDLTTGDKSEPADITPCFGCRSNQCFSKELCAKENFRYFTEA